MASTSFPDCRLIIKKTSQIALELDQKQEFFLACLHSRNLSPRCMEAIALIMILLIQLAGKFPSICLFSVFHKIFHGGRLIKPPPYNPTEANRSPRPANPLHMTPERITHPNSPNPPHKKHECRATNATPVFSVTNYQYKLFSSAHFTGASAYP